MPFPVIIMVTIIIMVMIIMIFILIFFRQLALTPEFAGEINFHFTVSIFISDPDLNRNPLRVSTLQMCFISNPKNSVEIVLETLFGSWPGASLVLENRKIRYLNRQFLIMRTLNEISYIVSCSGSLFHETVEALMNPELNCEVILTGTSTRF
jgi:hypothetical protein